MQGVTGWVKDAITFGREANMMLLAWESIDFSMETLFRATHRCWKLWYIYSRAIVVLSTHSISKPCAKKKM